MSDREAQKPATVMGAKIKKDDDIGDYQAYLTPDMAVGALIFLIKGPKDPRS